MHTFEHLDNVNILYMARNQFKSNLKVKICKHISKKFYLFPTLSSQIPSSAVEMPGSADIPGLNVQFGALDFGSEAGSGSVDVAHTEPARENAPTQGSASVPMPVSTQQPQSSLFSKPGPVRCVCARAHAFLHIVCSTLNLEPLTSMSTSCF